MFRLTPGPKAMPVRKEFEIILPDGDAALVHIKSNARARNLTLRYDDRERCFRLTIPEGYKPAAAEPFLERKREWMVACLSRTPEQDLADGAPFLFHGREYHLSFTGAQSRAISVGDGEISVGGPVDLAPGRLKRFLMDEAKTAISPMVLQYASELGASVPTIRFGDMRSRWGSCSSAGVIKLSWRLVMAPERVQSYVAAHEACHLLELNHSECFWTLVEAFIPDWRQDRRWLRTEGAKLQSVPFPK